jgi:hypothetical protein
MAELKEILDHSEWKKLKTTHGVTSSVSGVDVGKALETYHSKTSDLSPKHAQANGQAARALFDVLKKYADKMPPAPKHPDVFEKRVKALRDAAKGNAAYYEELAKSAVELATALANFPAEFERLADEIMIVDCLEKLDEMPCVRKLKEAAMKVNEDLHAYIAGELKTFATQNIGPIKQAIREHRPIPSIQKRDLEVVAKSITDMGISYLTTSLKLVR